MKYVQVSKNCKSFFSEICIQYAIIPGSNDNLDEIQNFIDKCENLKIKHIEFELPVHNISDLDNLKYDNLKNTISYIKILNKLSVTISDKLLNLIQ